MILKSRHVVAALVLHLLLFGLLFSGVQCTRKQVPVSIIQGVLITPTQVPKAQAEPVAQPQPEPPQPEPAKPDPAEAERQKAAEVNAKAEATRKREEILQKQAEAVALERKNAELKKQAEIEDKKRLADEARQKAEADEKKRADDLQKAAEAEDKKRLADAKKKKDEQLRADAEARRLREAELSAALGAETAERQAREASIWGTQLVAAIQRVWTRPADSNQNLKCVLNIKLSPTAEVLAASVVTSSGNSLFDQSVLRAVNAARLPLPADPTAFRPNINITFSP